uniref:Uncharacterized protein n=1 Tax=Arundo donax TaxID=35708 RepID=A0A0A9BK63_ARUDO
MAGLCLFFKQNLSILFQQ